MCSYQLTRLPMARVAVGQRFINHSAIGVIPYVFSVELQGEVGD